MYSILKTLMLAVHVYHGLKLVQETFATPHKLVAPALGSASQCWASARGRSAGRHSSSTGQQYAYLGWGGGRVEWNWMGRMKPVWEVELAVAYTARSYAPL